MDLSNFTPLPPRLSSQNKNSHEGVKFMFTCLSSFVGAGALVVFLYVGAITMNGNKPLTYKSKAAEPQINVSGLTCIKNNVAAPSVIMADIGKNDKKTQLQKGDIIDSLNKIHFSWQSMPGAVGYFIDISTDSANIVDPIVNGTRVEMTEYTYDKLLPNKSYRVFIRSVSSKNTYTLLYPTPFDCNYSIPALPLFEFKTK